MIFERENDDFSDENDDSEDSDDEIEAPDGYALLPSGRYHYWCWFDWKDWNRVNLPQQMVENEHKTGALAGFHSFWNENHK